MSKETVAQIRKAIEEAIRVKYLRKAQEYSIQLAELRGQEAEQQALIARNEARLRATGVVEQFEELRDSKVLMYNAGNPVTPVIIEWAFDKTRISIEFDFHYKLQEHSDYRGDQHVTRSRHLRAEIRQSGELIIGQHVMERGEKLGDVVRDEILRLKGLKE